MTNTTRRSFLEIGASAFAAAGVLPLFGLDDRQQWFEPVKALNTREIN